MNRKFGMAAALMLAGCAHVPPATPPIALDDLLAFSKPSECEQADSHSALLRTMWVGDDDAGIRAGKLDIPSRFANAFGPIRVAKDRDYTTVSVATRGTLFGLPLIEIVQAFPDGGDPPDTIYRFAASPAEVEQAASRHGLPAQAGRTVTLPEAGAYDHVMELLPDPKTEGHALLSCGFQ